MQAAHAVRTNHWKTCFEQTKTNAADKKGVKRAKGYQNAKLKPEERGNRASLNVQAHARTEQGNSIVLSAARYPMQAKQNSGAWTTN